MEVRKRPAAAGQPGAQAGYGNGGGLNQPPQLADGFSSSSSSSLLQQPSFRRRHPPSFSLFSRDPTLSGLLYVIIVVFYLSMLLFVYVRDAHLPEPRSAAISPSLFSEDRARGHLHSMLSWGIRNTGSPANEVYCARYIVHELLRIRRRALPGYVLDVSVQRPSGSFDLNFMGGFTSSYQNVTNILARLYYASPDDPPHINRTQISFLVSAHFDSALGSPAASDDAANIASMLEILSCLAHSPPLPHAVIFNFNGAEESILQAAHGFITQHPWAPSIAAFLNAEGAGGSGRELVFQLGPSHAWLAFAYARSAPYPFASSIAQDIFQSGIIPSDTDFRIYRDYGGLSGVDLAYITDGFVYHTPIDDEAHVVRGSMQRAGENILHTVQAIVASPQLVFAHPKYRHLCSQENRRPAPQSIADIIASHRIEFHHVNSRQHKATKWKEDSRAAADHSSSAEHDADDGGSVSANSSVAYFAVSGIQSVEDHLSDYECDEHELSSHAVFFDCVGTLMVIYSSRTALIVNVGSICLTVLYLLYQHHKALYTWQRTVKSLLLLIVSLLASVVSAALVAVVLLALDRTMRWYANPFLATGLYSIPTLLTLITLERMGTVLLFGDVTMLKDRESVVSPWHAEEQSFLSTTLLYLMLLVALVLADISSSLVFMLLCVLPILGRMLGKALDRARLFPAPPPPAHSWCFLVCYCVALCPPTVLIGYACYVVVYFFLPVMGRSGTELPSELVMAVLLSVCTFVCATASLSLAHLDRRWKLTSRVLLALFALSFIAALTLPAYSPQHPKRIVLQHVNRTWHQPHTHTDAVVYPLALTAVQRTDAGVLVNGLDWQGLRPLASHRLQAATAHGLRADQLATATPVPCIGVYCQLPYFYPFRKLVSAGVYLPAPSLGEGGFRTRLLLTRVEQLQPESASDRHRRRYHFVSEGAHHQVMLLRNVVGSEQAAELVGWSFHQAEHYRPMKRQHREQPILKSSIFPFSLGPFYDAEPERDRQSREDYFIFFSSGVDLTQPGEEQLNSWHVNLSHPVLPLPPPFDQLMPTPASLSATRRWSFWLEVRDNPRLLTETTGPHTLEVGIVNHFLDSSSPILQAMKSDMPDWCTTVHWVSRWNGYELQ